MMLAGLAALLLSADAVEATTPDPALRAFVLALQGAVRRNDCRMLAGMVQRPVRVNWSMASAKRSLWLSRSGFLRQCRSIFIPSVRASILAANPDAVEVVGYRGPMLGNGTLWFDHICPSRGRCVGPVRIATINVN